MQLKIVFKIVGILLMVFSFTQIPPLFIDFVSSEGQDISTFSFSFLITLIGGFVMWLPFFTVKENFRLREGILIVVSFWVVLSIFATIPFLLTDSIPDISFSAAFFESMSGLTTTGATTIENLDNLPKSILYYRQQLQWLGGMGIIVLAVAILPLLGVSSTNLYHAELSGISRERITPKLRQTAILLWKIYFYLTLFCALAYFLSGMDLFDAIVHSFSTVAIGGFSTYDASISHFDSIAVEFVAMLFMFLAGINFSLHFFAWNNLSIVSYWKDSEFKAYTFMMICFIVFVFIVLVLNNEYESIFDSFRYGSFQAISIATTTGFVSEKFNNWPSSLAIFLIMMSFIGACTGSTGGGIKVARILLIFKIGMKEIKQFIHPNAQINIKFNKSTLAQQTLLSVVGFLSLYIICFVIILGLLMLTGISEVSAFSATVATINNLGPGLGEVGQNYNDISDVSKWILSISMLFGRLELLTLVALFHRVFWRY